MQLVALPHPVLDKLPLPDSLRYAIDQAKSIKSHGATRRQAQLIGKLMRASEHDTIVAAYEALMAEDNAQTAAFHDLERWRDRLINEGKESLTEFIDQFHPADVQHLRQLVKKAVDEKSQPKPTGASKALFRFLRSCQL